MSLSFILGKKIDLTFSLSATSTNADQNFQLMTTVINNLVNKYQIGNTQYAALIYGSGVEVRPIAISVIVEYSRIAD